MGSVAIFCAYSICVKDEYGQILHRNIQGRSYCQDRNGRRYQYFALDGFEDYYGFGEKGGKLNKFRRRMRMYNCDTLGYDSERTDPLYKHIPFFIKRDPEKNIVCGVFFDSTAEGILDIGCEKSSYWEPYGYFCCDEGDIDCYIIAGQSIRDIVRGYTDLTGKTAMPTYQSLGYMASTMYFTEAERDADQKIQYFIEQLEKEDLGCDGFHLSSGYTSIDNKRCVFNWNHTRFPEPEKFVKWMNVHKVLVSPNIKPALLTENPLYQEFAENHAFICDENGDPHLERYWGGMASFVDFSRELGRKMWKTYMKQALLDIGITAIWDDNNEFEISDEEAVCGEKGEIKARSIKPAFANLMAKTALEAIAETDNNMRPYVLSRAGYAGIQRYAQTWAGDNETSWKTLKYNIPIMLGLGLSGVANQGCDIGGFLGPAPDAELFVRWIQNGIFQPRFCIHSCNTDNTVTLPFSYPEQIDNIRNAFRLRYSLGLYLYSLFRQAAVQGDPIMRPMIYEFEDEDCERDNSFDFMYGPFILVANVLEQGANMREVYLPKGHTWYNWNTHEKYQGGQKIVVSAPLETIPMFYRSGSIIPIVKPSNRMTVEQFEFVKLQMEISKKSTFTLYQDDGCSKEYQNGKFLETEVTIIPECDAVYISFVQNGNDRDRTVSYELCADGRMESPLRVLLGERELPVSLNMREYEEMEEGFYFNTERHQALVKYKNPGCNACVILDYKIQDLNKFDYSEG